MKKETVRSQALQDNEVAANKAIALGCAITAIVVLIVWILILTRVFALRNNNWVNVNFPVVIGLLTLSFALSRTKLVNRPFFKYYVLFTFTLIIAVVNVALPKHAVLAWAAAIVVASHYYSPKTVVVTFILAALLMAASIPLAMIYGEWDANLMGITDESFLQLHILYPDKPLPHGGTNPYDLEDRLYFLNHYNDYFVSLNRWVASIAYYYASRLICLIVVFILSLQINKRFEKLFYEEINSREEKSKLSAELNVARDIQLSALPHEFPKNDKFDVYALTSPAKEVGGDFYNAFVHGNKLFFLIGDVSGKGVPSALFMMKTMTLICSLLKGGEGDPSLALKYTNQELCIQNDKGMFVTAIVGCLNLDNGEVSLANAGHNPMLLKDGDQYDYFKLPKGFILGGFENIKYQTVKRKFVKNNCIFLYTDGVTEAMNNNGELYGEKRLQEFLNSLPSTYLAAEICNAVKEDVKRFADGAEQNDDITMLAMKYIDNDKSNSFSLPVDKAEVEKVNAFIEEYLEPYNVSGKILSQIGVAVDEICSNIFNYAYKDKKGKITVNVEYRDGIVSIRFIDNGVKFNPLEKEDPDTSLGLEERGIGGLGIFMVKKLMDDVQYEYSEKKENILTIIKKVGE